jgi:hypothetical protein
MNGEFSLPRRLWAAAEPFLLSLRDGAKATGTLAVGVLLLGAGAWLSWASDWWLLDWASAIAPKLAEWVILVLLHLARIALLIAGAIYVSSGRSALRNWWLASPFVWRTMPIDDDGAFRVEARPFVHTISRLVLGSIASAIAFLAAFIGLVLIASAVRVDSDLARLVAHFVNGDVGARELIAGRALLIGAAMIAGLAALNRRRAAMLYFEGAP